METQCVSSYCTQLPPTSLPKQSVIFLDEFSELLSIIHSNYDRMIIRDFKLCSENPADSKAMDF